jgi:hypothetical protein
MLLCSGLARFGQVSSRMGQVACPRSLLTSSPASWEGLNRSPKTSHVGGQVFKCHVYSAGFPKNVPSQKSTPDAPFTAHQMLPANIDLHTVHVCLLGRLEARQAGEYQGCSGGDGLIDSGIPVMVTRRIRMLADDLIPPWPATE